VTWLSLPGAPDSRGPWLAAARTHFCNRLFAEGTRPANLQLRDSTVAMTGVIMATYRPAGAIEYGSFALE